MFQVPQKPALLDRRHTEFILPSARLKGAFRRVFLPYLRVITVEVIEEAFATRQLKVAK